MYVLLHGHLLGVECDQGSPLFCRMEGPWGGGSRGKGTEMGEKEETLTPQLEEALNPGCR